MEAFKIVETVLYILSNLFFYPVITALFFLLARICYGLGTFAKEYWLRSRTPGYFTIPFLQKINAFDSTDTAIEIELHSVLEQAEQKGFLAIQSSRYSVKMGPTLGLIGTLTPMAKALSGLSQGNLKQPFHANDHCFLHDCHWPGHWRNGLYTDACPFKMAAPGSLPAIQKSRRKTNG